jgi:hypothetical protein
MVEKADQHRTCRRLAFSRSVRRPADGATVQSEREGRGLKRPGRRMWVTGAGDPVRKCGPTRTTPWRLRTHYLSALALSMQQSHAKQGERHGKDTTQPIITAVCLVLFRRRKRHRKESENRALLSGRLGQFRWIMYRLLMSMMRCFSRQLHALGPRTS